MTREALRAKLKEQVGTGDTSHERVPVSPQRRRQAMRGRVDERAKSVAARVLKDLGLAPAGREIGQAVASARGRANRVAVIELLNRHINAFVGIGKGKRAEMTSDQAERVFAALDALGDKVRAEVAAGGKKGKK